MPTPMHANICVSVKNLKINILNIIKHILFLCHLRNKELQIQKICILSDSSHIIHLVFQLEKFTYIPQILCLINTHNDLHLKTVI